MEVNNEKELRLLLKLGAESVGVPIRIYKCNNKIDFFSFIPMVADPFDLYKEDLSKLSIGGQWICSDHFYYIAINNSQYQVVVGPVGDDAKNPHSNVRRIGESLNLSKQDTDLLIRQINLLRKNSLLKLIILEKQIILFMCGELPDPEDISLLGISPAMIDLLDPNGDITWDAKSLSPEPKTDLTPIENLIETSVTEGNENLVKDLVTLDKGIFDFNPRFLENDVENAKLSFYHSMSRLLKSASIPDISDPDLDYIKEKYIEKLKRAGSVEDVNELKRQLLLDLANHNNKPVDVSRCSKMIKDVAEYIDHNINKPLTVNGIAEDLFISRSKLSTKFKREVGIELSQYIREKKIELAKDMLCDSNNSIAYVCDSTGFVNLSHFSTVFKRFEGMTPSKYRERNIRKSSDVKA